MKRKSSRAGIRKLFLIALILMVTTAFTPAFGESPVPASEGSDTGKVEASAPEESSREELSADEEVSIETPADPDVTDATIETKEPKAGSEKESRSKEGKASKGTDLKFKGVSGKSILAGNGQSEICAYDKAKGIATITLPEEWRIGTVYVDNSSDSYRQELGFKTNKCTVDMKHYQPGYHVIYFQVKIGSDVKLVYWEDVLAPLTDKPNYKGVFNVYGKYFNYYPYNFGCNQLHRLFIEYKPVNSKKWKRSGYMTCNSITLYTDQGFKISGLRPNTRYNTRIRYGEVVSRADGSTVMIYGPARGTGTYKTGMASKPPIKSIKVKAIKVRHHKIRHYGYYTGVYLYTEKFWTYKLKVTVKMKKKPGTGGIWINGKWLKGNKKKYTTVFTPYPNYRVKKPPKGMKYTVSVKTGQSKGYGGYSPTFKKTYKVKKR